MQALLQKLQPWIEAGRPWVERLQPWLDEHLPWISPQALLVWLGIAVLHAACGACRSLSGLPRQISLVAFALSCAWVWKGQGAPVFIHSWLAASLAALLLGLLVRLLGLLSRRTAGWSLANLLLSPVLWPFQILPAMREIFRFLGLLPACPRAGTRVLTVAPPKELGPLECPAISFDPAPAGSPPTQVKEPLHSQAAPAAFTFASASRFSHLDLAFYDQTRATLEAHHFTHLYDIELPGARRALEMPGFLRALRSPDHCVCAAFWHTRPVGWVRLLAIFLPSWRARQPCHAYRFETEFEDGSFVITASAGAEPALPCPAHLDEKSFPGHDLNALGHLHYERLAAHGSACSTHPMKIHSVQAALDMRQRLQQARTAASGQHPRGGHKAAMDEGGAWPRIQAGEPGS